MVIFNSHVSHYQRENPIRSHKTTIFLWFSYGNPPNAVCCTILYLSLSVQRRWHLFLWLDQHIDLVQEGAS